MDEIWSYYYDIMTSDSNCGRGGRSIMKLMCSRLNRSVSGGIKLLDMFKPFPNKRTYADNNYTYRERLYRKIMYFSKNKEIHTAVIGAFVNIFL